MTNHEQPIGDKIMNITKSQLITNLLSAKTAEEARLLDLKISGVNSIIDSLNRSLVDLTAARDRLTGAQPKGADGKPFYDKQIADVIAQLEAIQ